MLTVLLVVLWGFNCYIHASPFSRILVDMSHVFEENTYGYPGMTLFKSKIVRNPSMRDDDWLYVEDYTSGTHVGTHMDAPAHFIPGGRTIDQIPLSQFFAPAAVIDITCKAKLDPNAEVEVEDLQDWEAKTGRTLDGHIVLMRSGWGKRYANRTAYLGTDTDVDEVKSPGLSSGACNWLVNNRQIPGVGVDTVSLDSGNGLRNGNPAHFILLGAGLFGVENVANMERIPVSGARVTVLPTKIAKGSGAPVRMLATVPAVDCTSCETSLCPGDKK